ncbi:MAG: FixH family protein [Gemmatimonadaceae bacterium]|jgi:nitrogen fixation protein FixH|nr:FixH family protein [Gemmatimonadaceae bacterium]
MKKGLGWPIGIATILFATVASNVGVILITKDDPSFAVEPDYYRKAVEWDSTSARRARSDALGWQVTPTVQVGGTNSELSLTLVDAQGAPIDGATIAGELLHVARASQMQTVQFTARNGGYVATVQMPRAGVWELRLDATRGDQRFLRTVRLETALADASVPVTPEPRDGP